jgi:hypothetical protein
VIIHNDLVSNGSINVYFARSPMRFLLCGFALCLVLSLGVVLAQPPSGSRYLVTWVGDGDGADSDFLAVVDVALGSKTYGQVVNTAPVGASKTVPHHTEHFFSPGHPLFANGYAGNQTFRFDLSDPAHPKLLGNLSAVPGLAFPHRFARLPNGNVLATMQARGDDFIPPGGLAEFRDDGSVVRSASGENDIDPGTRLYSLLVLPGRDRIIVGCGRMGIAGRGMAGPLDHTGFAIQLWRLSDLKLLKTVALTSLPGSRPNAYLNPYEPRLLPNGEVLLATGQGALYRISGFEPETFGAEFVFDFGSGGVAVPVMVGNYWIQPVGGLRRVVALNVTNPRKPTEISRVQFDDRQQPHWLSLDSSSNRIVMANSGDGTEPRLWMLQFDPLSGLLSVDTTFRQPGDDQAGISFDRQEWPHGKTGTGIPHGSVFIQ